MARILHYVKSLNDGGRPQVSLTFGRVEAEEYVVISEEDSPEVEADNCVKGYELYGSYELEDTGTLPTDRPLAA